MLVYVFRHAESEANVARIIASAPAEAVGSWGLTERGYSQVREATLPDAFGRDTLVVSSDFKRARETAETLAIRIGCPAPIFSEALRERHFGPFEGKEDAYYRHVWEFDARGETCPGVESVESVARRVECLLGELRSRHDDATIVLVSHGDVLQVALAVARGFSPFRHREIPHLGNAECRELGSRSSGYVDCRFPAFSASER